MGSMLVHYSNACRSLMYESEVLEVHEGMLLSVSSDWYSNNSSISLCLHMPRINTVATISACTLFIITVNL